MKRLVVIMAALLAPPPGGALPIWSAGNREGRKWSLHPARKRNCRGGMGLFAE